jgi:hypothetical protein
MLVQKPGWRVMHMNLEGVILGGSDSFALYESVKSDKVNKADLLKTLVKMGWNIPEDEQ